jgi:hypothetical protein
MKIYRVTFAGAWIFLLNDLLSVAVGVMFLDFIVAFLKYKFMLEYRIR